VVLILNFNNRVARGAPAQIINGTLTLHDFQGEFDRSTGLGVLPVSLLRRLKAQ
jgi:hypothetical protein